jgi:hypothetical protein
LTNFCLNTWHPTWSNLLSLDSKTVRMNLAFLTLDWNTIFQCQFEFERGPLVRIIYLNMWHLIQRNIKLFCLNLNMVDLAWYNIKWFLTNYFPPSLSRGWETFSLAVEDSWILPGNISIPWLRHPAWRYCNIVLNVRKIVYKYHFLTFCLISVSEGPLFICQLMYNGKSKTKGHFSLLQKWCW